MSLFNTISLRNEEVQKKEMGLTQFILIDTLESGEVNQDTTGIKPKYNWLNFHSTFIVCSMYVQCTSNYRL